MSKPLNLKDFEAKIEKSKDNKNGWIKYNNTYIHHVNGSYHNDPKLGYGLVSFKYDDNVDYTITYEDSLQHNLNGPSKLSYDSNGNVVKKDYYIEGRHYATEKHWAEEVAKRKPAVKTDEQKWLKANESLGYVKNTVSPDLVSYSKTNDIGELHSDNGPAVVYFHSNGSMQRIVHYKNGKIHNTKGPAVVKFTYGNNNANGGIPELDITNEYWLDGKFETFQEPEFARMVMNRRVIEAFTPEVLKKYFPVGVKDYALKTITGTYAAGASSVELDGYILHSKGGKYVYFNNLEKGALNSWTNWYGPLELELKPDGSIEKKYFLRGQGCSFADWKLALLKNENGIPAFVRNTEANKYKRDMEGGIAEYDKAQLVEKIINFADSPAQLYSGMVYVYDNSLYLLFKLGGNLYEKKISLKPTITSDGTLKIQSECRMARIDTDKANRKHIVDPSTYKVLSDEEFDKQYTEFTSLRDMFNKLVEQSVAGMNGTSATATDYKISYGTLKESNVVTTTAAATTAIPVTLYGVPYVLSKTPQKPATVKDVVVSDSKEVLKRISVMKITSFVQELLVASSMKQGAQANKLREALKSVFESERGRVVLSFLIGATMPVLTSKLPEKYHPLLEEIATEFRVQAETVVISKLVEAVAGGVWGTVQESLDRILNRPAETRIRVEVMSDAPLTAEGAELESSEATITLPVDNKLLN
jgi:hypothetical protein